LDTKANSPQISFTFDITPVACGRPRLGRWGVFNPPKTTEYKKALAGLLTAQLVNNMQLTNQIAILYDKPICLSVTFHLPIPKKLIKKNSEPWRKAMATSKPDCDNLVKSFLDVLSGVVFKDDAQVTHLAVRKMYNGNPHVHVVIEESSMGTWE
jgi:Holliday junction resolvase RusA-like endonuclease